MIREIVKMLLATLADPNVADNHMRTFHPLGDPEEQRTVRKKGGPRDLQAVQRLECPLGLCFCVFDWVLLAALKWAFGMSFSLR